MKAFHAVRQHAAKKEWPATFVTSGKYASCFIDLNDERSGTVRGTLLETHGTRQEAGLAMRKHLLALGLLQRGPGAPKGNANASAKNRSKKVVAAVSESSSQNWDRFCASVVSAKGNALTSYLESNVGLYGGPVGETLDEANLRVAGESLSKTDMVVAQAKPIDGMRLRPYQRASLERLKADFKKADVRAGVPATGGRGLLKSAIEATTKRPGAPKKGSMEEMQEIQNRMNAAVLMGNPALVAKIKADVAKRTIEGVVVKKSTVIGATNDSALLAPSKKRSHHKIVPAKRSHHKKKA